MTRAAADIGAGLAPARPARPIAPGERIHVIGAAGAGASAAALLAHHAGAAVTGCDAGGPSPYTPALVAAGVPLAWEHAASHVEAAAAPDRLAVTKALTAIDPDHAELMAARASGIPLEPWQQVVADAAVGRRLVAISGTHGKSTTAGWLVHVLVAAGVDPSAFVGALLPAPVTGGVASTARWGGGDAFVVEADEYAGNFDAYRPDVAVLTSVEWDHPDVFADQDAVEAAFAGWLRGIAPGGTLVANVADPGVRAVLDRLGAAWTGRVVPYRLLDAPATATNPGAPGATTPARVAGGVVGRVTAATTEGTTLQLAGLDKDTITVHIGMAGRHNAANALAVATSAHVLGVPARDIATHIGSFPGVGRRLERKGESGGVVVYDDYGHHPTAIRETVVAMRQREPGRRLWAVYEPLTYHRTAALLSAFAAALATADAVAIADIWAGRDPDTTVASAAGLAQAVTDIGAGIVAAAPGSVDETAAWLADQVRPGDSVLVMGGGRSYRIATGLLERLERRSTT